MPYPTPLHVVARKLTENLVVCASSFKVLTLNMGARMALFNYRGSVIVWSAMPYGPHLDEAFELLGLRNVEFIFLPNFQHTVGAKLFKAAFPAAKVVGMAHDKMTLKPDITISEGNRILKDDELAALGLGAISGHFELVFLPHHGNKELVVYDKNAKTVFEADLLFNVRPDASNEQYSAKLGYMDDFWQHGGWSFFTRYFNPDSVIGRYFSNRLSKSTLSKEGLEAILSWDFERVVVSHGNIIEKGGKEEFRKVYGHVLSG